MTQLDITATTSIAAPVDVVRRQFADVAHHASTHPHRGVRFEVIDDDADRCRYRQTTRVGPLRLHQELELDRRVDQPLVNQIKKGQLAGGAITFDITSDGEGCSQVAATVSAPLSGPMRLGSPLLRQTVRRALVRALREDKHDLESGTYGT